MKNAEAPAKLFHIVIGTPNEEHCPICRTHLVSKGDPESDGPASPMVLQEHTMAEILRFPCPLCQEARQAGPEEPPPKQDRD